MQSKHHHIALHACVCACRCPITLAVMREPTQASSGVTYERSAIFHWLQLHRVDPVTHVPLKRHRLAPNLNLRHMIEAWATEQQQLRAVVAGGDGDRHSAGSFSSAADAAACTASGTEDSGSLIAC